MDHIIANMDNPVPADLSTLSTASGTPAEMEDDDEDDQEALAAHIKKTGGDPSKADDVEAKSVKCSDVSPCWRSMLETNLKCLMSWRFLVRQNL